MKKVSKKEIRASVKSALMNVAAAVEIQAPSKKVSKLIDKFSKKISAGLRDEVKKLSRKEGKSKSMSVKNAAAA